MNYRELLESFTDNVVDNAKDVSQKEKRSSVIDVKEIIVEKTKDIIENFIAERYAYQQGKDEFSLPGYVGMYVNDKGQYIFEFESDNLEITNTYGDEDYACFTIVIESISDNTVKFNTNIGYNHCIQDSYEYKISEFLDDPSELIVEMIEEAIDNFDIYEE